MSSASPLTQPLSPRRQFLLGCLLGGAAFLLLFGLAPLDVTNDLWLRGGFVEKDAIQHYTGWLFYRESALSVPFCTAEHINWPQGLSVAFTDSIPLFAALFRLFEGLLPDVFQYFGLYAFPCFVLQGGFAALLLGLFTRSLPALTLGCLPFVFSPVLVERTFRHTSLGAQFLILAALYYYVRGRREQRACWPGLFAINVLTITLHPYFIPMTYALTAALVLGVIADTRKPARPVGFLAGNLVATVAAGWLFGLFTGSAEGGSTVEFGYFGMNLNALWNPISRWTTVWSRVLPVQNQVRGNYDAFNYLGLGMLLGCVLLAVCALRRLQESLGWVRRHWPLLLVCGCLTVFAVSHVVTANGATLFTLPLPHALVRLATTFRSGGRMFWPVYYLIFTCCIVTVLRLKPQKAALGALALLVAVQLWDISPALIERGNQMRGYQTEYPSPLTSAFWDEAAERYDHIVSLDELQEEPLHLALWAADHGLTTNDPFAARWDEEALAEQRRTTIDALLGGRAEADCLYLIHEEALFLQFAEVLQADAFCAYLEGGWYVIAPGLDYVGADAVVYGLQGEGFPLRISDYTDSIWDKGVLVREEPYQTLLFPDCAFTRRRLEGMTALAADGEEYPILKLDDKDAGWLMVTLDIPDARILQGKELESIS